ncbi:glycoside hydrolase family protein [Novipirellula artificiosorum]|nr:glycoside hydrolase [Novipirellula artificiosorum]
MSKAVLTVALLAPLALVPAAEPPARGFPGRLPLTKPTDRPLSAAMQRAYDFWGIASLGSPRGVSQNDRMELYSNFRYSRLEGFDYSCNTSRRDPTKVLKIDGTYYVWYTHRKTEAPPSGTGKATDTIPSADWDLAEIWYATSNDGFAWQEQGVAVPRPPKPDYGWRSVTTPDVLVFKGKYYLYYKGQPIHSSDESPGLELVRAQGLAISEDPLGPFTKHPLNPVITSGHETCLFPWKGGIAAITSLDGPEKNTVQFAPDGVNFEIMSSIEMPPLAPGPFVADAFSDNEDGRGITWGLCHIPPPVDATAPGNWAENAHFTLARFDCDLSRDTHRSNFKSTYPGRYDEEAFFSSRAHLSGWLLNQVKKEQQQLDRNTILQQQ